MGHGKRQGTAHLGDVERQRPETSASRRASDLAGTANSISREPGGIDDEASSTHQDDGLGHGLDPVGVLLAQRHLERHGV